MESDMPYEIPRDRIAHETIGDEVVILDQIAGSYYSLTGAGTDAWALLVAGSSPEEIISTLTRRFDAPADVVAEAVRALVDELVRHELLVVAPERTPGPEAAVASDGAPMAAWVAPRLERFDDLQALLVLDPIHDVDDTGWPRKAADPA